MKYLITALLCAFIAASFTGHKCKHVYVAVEQDSIKVNTSLNSVIDIYNVPVGFKEGKELVCVKCFNRIRQVVDYGQPFSGSLEWQRGPWINAGPSLNVDSLSTQVNILRSPGKAVICLQMPDSTDTDGGWYIHRRDTLHK